MLDRRGFVKMLAALAAGATATPAVLGTFERYYDANTPQSAGPFLAIDEISLVGLAIKPTPLRVDFLDGDRKLLPIGLNAFGGVYFWRAPIDGKIVAHPRQITWKMRDRLDSPIADMWVPENLSGHISFIGSDAIRRTLPITTARGVVA